MLHPRRRPALRAPAAACKEPTACAVYPGMMPEEPAARGAPCPSLPVHVTIGTHRRLPVFADEAVALNVYLLVREHPLTLAAVLMPNHLHWLLARSADLERTVERFKTHSTRRAEAAGHQGRLWQPSYFDALVEPESRLRRIAAYLLTNPVAAELAPSWGEYPWACLHPSLTE